MEGQEEDSEENLEEKSEENSQENVINIEFDWDNRYSACLGFFMTIFDDDNECPVIESSKKKICGHSRNVEIRFDGGFYNTRSDSQCGVNAVENILSRSFIQHFPESLWKKKTNIFGDLVENLEDIGYQKGFSLSAVPNDFRKFIKTNNFAYESLKFHIENMYQLTGKPVIIIAHSFGNLVTLNTLTKDKSLKDKIRKWIAIAPPFAGATKAIDNFLHGIDDFDTLIIPNFARSEFHKFGQFMMLKSIPTVYELKPNLNLYNQMQKPEYTDFKDAIIKRILLEKQCKEGCTDEIKKMGSVLFDQYFQEYFPSLTREECKYESSIGGSIDALSQKCMTGIFNFIEYPTIIKEKQTNNLNETKYNIDDYQNKTGSNYYYLSNCEEKHNINTKCINDIFPEVRYVYDKFKEEIEDLLRRYNNKYKDSYLDKTILETKEEVKEIINKMINYQEENNLIKDLPIPPVDVDIIYSSFNPTLAAEFVDVDDIDLKQLGSEKKGGDGTVPTYSSLLVALKWIYEKQKNNLPQKIKLVEYCSRLANSGFNLPNFKPISCQCLSKSNEYTDPLSDCSHQDMLTDQKLFEYIIGETMSNEESEEIINNKKEAISKYSSKKDYMDLCNLKLYNIINRDEKIKCGENPKITKEQYESDNYCSNQGYSKMNGRECCSVHLHGTDSSNKEFDNYFCENIKNDKSSKEFFIDEIKERKRFFEKENLEKVEIKCKSSYLDIYKKLLLLFSILI